MHLPIKVSQSGFYRGFTKNVTITAKILVGALIIWAVAFPDQAGDVLSALNKVILATFSYWYVFVMAFFVILCFCLALWPASGRLKMGMPDDKPEFSNFSWFSMMFGAGIGIGMLTFATAEPMYHWGTNPSTIQGLTEGSTAGNVRDAYVWSFTHWGLAAWASYATVGLALGYFSYRRGLPLTIRSWANHCLALSGTLLTLSLLSPLSWVYHRPSDLGLNSLSPAFTALVLANGSIMSMQKVRNHLQPWLLS